MKNAERFGKAASHQLHTPRAPGPEMWANIIDVPNPFRTELARHAQVTAGKIRGDGERGLTTARFFYTMTPGAKERGQAPQCLGGPKDAPCGIVCDDVHA